MTVTVIAFNDPAGATAPVSVSAATPLPVTSSAVGTGSAGTDRSTTATTTSAALMPANAARTKFFVKNDTAVIVYINMGPTATAAAGSGNIQIAANGGYFEFLGYTGVVSIIAVATTAAVTAREF